MNETKQPFYKNKQIAIWLIIISATLLLVAALLIFLVKDTTTFQSVSVPVEDSDEMLDLTKPDELNADYYQITLNDFAKFYNGTRESMDGSIEAVMLEIKNIDQDNLSYDFVLNIGAGKKLRGVGYIDLQLREINADALGILKFSARRDGRIRLTTSDSTRAVKYNLIEESK